MRNTNQRRWRLACGLLALFALWTLAVSRIDVQAIGPQGSSVGFASLNAAVHRLTGVHMALYTLTDWLGLLPLLVVLGFAALGLAQLIQRKSLMKVDRSILALGGFYMLVMAAYLLFEEVVVNYRPVLIEGRLEASYPSSTTMLVLCVMPTAIMQLSRRIRSRHLKICVTVVLTAFSVFMVVGRLLSGVHWLSDIVGGLLLSAGLVALYAAAAQKE